MRLHRLDPFAARHHGLVNLRAAQRLGVSRSAWYRAVASNQLELLYPNVARLWGAPETFPQRALAAVWASGAHAVASHRTSARLWGVERPGNDPLEVLIRTPGRHPRTNGVIVHRPRDLLDLRPIMRFNIPTTNPLRMLLDLGAVDPGAVESAMIDMLSAKVVSPAALRSTLYRHARKGRNGVIAYRQAIESWMADELPPDSLLEAEMNRVIERFRLPPMQFHAMVIGYEVDFLVVGTNVVLECDGWAEHGLNRDQFEFDRLRNGELVAAGYAIVPFTWRMLTSDPTTVADRVRRAVESWSRRSA